MTVRMAVGLAVVAFFTTASTLSASQTEVMKGVECLKKPRLAGTTIRPGDEKRYSGISTCHHRPAEFSRTHAPTQPRVVPDDDYKLGYIFTPAYLSSPQIALPALWRPVSGGSSNNHN